MCELDHRSHIVEKELEEGRLLGVCVQVQGERTQAWTLAARPGGERKALRTHSQVVTCQLCISLIVNL